METKEGFSPFVIGLGNINKTKISIVGGKGANLGELAGVEGINVPGGFCITTEAFKKIVKESQVNELLEQLAQVKAEDRNAVRELGGKIRSTIEAATIPGDISGDITRLISQLDENDAYAVRSSATAEDLPTASFAGQQDTYLNIIGKEAILKHISKCWASLFTERAIIYRIQNGFDHRQVYLAVIVQKMVFPQAAGIMFTADPITANRKVVSIDASFGLGEAVVSGKVNADVYKVREGEIIDKRVSAKKLAIYALKNGGTAEREIDPELQNRQTLTDEQILQLERMGRKIENHFGSPQDMEWCLADDTFYIVQSRPITTLYPIIKANDAENHVYISVGHNQMMTDAMKPLGLSFFLLTTSASMNTAGGRLFVDATKNLASPVSRKILLDAFGKSDHLIKDALLTIAEREGFIKPADVPADSKNIPTGTSAPLENDPEIVNELIRNSEESLAALKQDIQTKSGTDLFDFIKDHIDLQKKGIFSPQSLRVIIAAMDASGWINEKMIEWLGEKNAVDTLSQSVPNNITSQMGLALLDVADVIRPYPEVIEYLQHAQDDSFLNEIGELNGGTEARDAINA